MLLNDSDYIKDGTSDNFSESVEESTGLKVKHASRYSLKDSFKYRTEGELATENEDRPHFINSQSAINIDPSFSTNPEISSDAVITLTTKENRNVRG